MAVRTSARNTSQVTVQNTSNGLHAYKIQLCSYRAAANLVDHGWQTRSLQQLQRKPCRICRRKSVLMARPTLSSPLQKLPIYDI